jgi:hypothetical protein
MVQRLEHQSQVMAGIGCGNGLGDAADEIQPLLRSGQILGMLARIDFDTGDRAVGMAGEQFARQPGRPAAEFDDLLATWRHQAGEKVEFVVDDDH